MERNPLKDEPLPRGEKKAGGMLEALGVYKSFFAAALALDLAACASIPSRTERDPAQQVAAVEALAGLGANPDIANYCHLEINPSPDGTPPIALSIRQLHGYGRLTTEQAKTELSKIFTAPFAVAVMDAITENQKEIVDILSSLRLHETDPVPVVYLEGLSHKDAEMLEHQHDQLHYLREGFNSLSITDEKEAALWFFASVDEGSLLKKDPPSYYGVKAMEVFDNFLSQKIMGAGKAGITDPVISAMRERKAELRREFPWLFLTDEQKAHYGYSGAMEAFGNGDVMLRAGESPHYNERGWRALENEIKLAKSGASRDALEDARKAFEKLQGYRDRYVMELVRIAHAERAKEPEKKAPVPVIIFGASHRFPGTVECTPKGLMHAPEILSRI